MHRWIEHQGQLYNLDHFTQISFGDDDEILLSVETHNMDWDYEEKHCSLKFKSQEERNLAMENIAKRLSL